MPFIIDDVAAAAVTEAAAEVTEVVTESVDALQESTIDGIDASKDIPINKTDANIGSQFVDILDTSADLDGSLSEFTGVGNQMSEKVVLGKTDTPFVDILDTPIDLNSSLSASVPPETNPLVSNATPANLNSYSTEPSTLQSKEKLGETGKSQFDVNPEKLERNPERFSEINQYSTSDQIQEYRGNSDNKQLIEGAPKDANVLRKNMVETMGEYAKDIDNSNSRAHHIVGNNEYSGESKAILENYDIDINTPENGIFLPQDELSDLHGTIHNGKHTQAYNDGVTQRLKMATCKDDVLEILDSIKEDLYNGDMELYNNHKYNI